MIRGTFAFCLLKKGRPALPVRDLHAEAFDSETKEKLEIYASYLREFLPVFLLSNKAIKAIQIFDFFAGPGKDLNGIPGSPLITCKIVDEALRMYGKVSSPSINLFFNEFNKAKHGQLSKCLEEKKQFRSNVTIETSCKDFPDAFEEQYPLMLGNANLVFLDQNGVKQITESVFQRIVQLPRTDFIFFISSAMVNRFKDLPEMKQYVPLRPEDYEGMNGTNVHRRVTEAYRRLIPKTQDYYLGSFSIKKGPNVYGLVFGSGHPLGIDKFLRVSWKHGGDANFDIDDDRLDQRAPSLWEEFDKPKKLAQFEKALAEKVVSREISNNKEAYIFALENGFLGSHAKQALQKMIKDGILAAQAFSISYGAWHNVEANPIRFK